MVDTGHHVGPTCYGAQNKAAFDCPDGEIIEIVDAFYGRLDKTTCPSTHA